MPSGTRLSSLDGRPHSRGYQGSSLTCPHCHADARFVGYRPKGLLSLLGAIRPARAYYHCPQCHQGHCPGDGVIGLSASDLTPGAAQAVRLAGVIVSFAEAADEVFSRLAGLHISEATAQRTTETARQELGRRLADGSVAAVYGAELKATGPAAGPMQ